MFQDGSQVAPQREILAAMGERWGEVGTAYRIRGLNQHAACAQANARASLNIKSKKGKHWVQDGCASCDEKGQHVLVGGCNEATRVLKSEIVQKVVQSRVRILKP